MFNRQYIMHFTQSNHCRCHALGGNAVLLLRNLATDFVHLVALLMAHTFLDH